MAAMSLEPETMEIEANVPQGRLLTASLLGLAGLSIIIATTVMWVIIAEKSAAFYGLPKEARDAAGTQAFVDRGFGSLDDSNQRLASVGFVRALPAWLAPLSFVGIALLFLAISIAFTAIMQRVQLRMRVMMIALPKLVKR